jgi:hypothetical protein
MLNIQLPYWEAALSLPDVESPLWLDFLTGGSRESLVVNKLEQIGDLSAYSVEPEDFIQLKIRNQSDKQLHVYMMEIDTDGRVLLFGFGGIPNCRRVCHPLFVRRLFSVMECNRDLGMRSWLPQRIDCWFLPLAVGARGVDAISIAERCSSKSIRYIVEERFSLMSWYLALIDKAVESTEVDLTTEVGDENSMLSIAFHLAALLCRELQLPRRAKSDAALSFICCPTADQPVAAQLDISTNTVFSLMVVCAD